MNMERSLSQSYSLIIPYLGKLLVFSLSFELFPDFMFLLSRVPNQFKCDMRPRSPKALSLIKQSEMPVV